MGEKKRVLVVDDNELNIEILRENLEECYHLETALSGPEALDKMRTFYPEIILLDIMMPEMDGYTVCRKIREDQRFAFTKIIIVSAKTLESERLVGYEAGADDYITKPFNQDELMAKLRVYSRLQSEEKMNRMKDDLLILLSHETNTPLNSIKGFADLLLKTTSLDEKQKMYVRTIYEAGDSLENFLHKALLLSGLKGEEYRLSLAPRSLREMVTKAVDALASQAQTKDVRIVLSGEVDGLVACESSLLETAFKAVLDNAIKFSPEGEDVQVEIGTEGREYVIQVKNVGEGIPLDQLSSIFEPFGVRDIGHHHHGQGLSLAIARNIMARHGGGLYARDTQDGGACFVFRLPISANN